MYERNGPFQDVRPLVTHQGGSGYLGAKSIPLDYQGLGFGSWPGDSVGDGLLRVHLEWPKVAQAPPCDLGVEQLAGSCGSPTVTPGPLRPGREPQPAMDMGVWL